MGVRELLARSVWRSTEWESSGVPARALGWRLGTSPVAKSAAGWGLVVRLAAAGKAGGSHVDWWGQSYYLWGPTGVGKTGLAVGYLHQWVDPAFGEPGRVAYWSVPDLLGALRASYEGKVRRGEGEAAILRGCREADCLVLDDVGVEQVTFSGWAEDRLYQVIGHRHAELLPSVFTSNLSLAELGGRIGERLAWRILEMCGGANVVHVEGPNLRDVGAVVGGRGG